MVQCPHCGSDLEDLDPVMDKLSGDKLNGVHFFDCRHCGSSLRAFSSVSMYYLQPADGSAPPKLIGAA